MPRRLARHVFPFAASILFVMLFFLPATVGAKKKRAPAGGRAAVVVDERLAALRDAPNLSANLLQRLGRGRTVALRGASVARDGVTFYRVNVTSRTSGWVQADAVAGVARAGDDERLLKLIRGSDGFDLIERAALFLETFPRSAHRPAVLSLLAEAADAAAKRLTQDATRRLTAREMEAGGAPVHSYFLNYNGLDRFNRLGVRFTFERGPKQFRYDGWAWREILRRHPQSPEARQAGSRLAALSSK